MAKVRRVKPAGKVSSPRKSLDDILLPDSPNEPPTTLEECITCLYGRKNIGKSSLAAQFENSITMMFERGRFNLNILQVPKKGEPALTWTRAKKYRDLICESDEIQHVNIDTADQCYNRCFEAICKEYGCRHPAEKKDGHQVWNAIKDEFDEFINSFRDAGKGLTLISHEKAKPLATKAKGLKRDGDAEETTFQYERMEPSFTGQVFGVVQEICDYVFYYGFKDGQRAITVRSPLDIHWTACGMGETFCDPDGNPLQTFAAGSSPQEAYEALIKAFNNELYDMDYVPPPSERVSSLGRKKKKATRRK